MPKLYVKATDTGLVISNVFRFPYLENPKMVLYTNFHSRVIINKSKDLYITVNSTCDSSADEGE